MGLNAETLTIGIVTVVALVCAIVGLVKMIKYFKNTPSAQRTKKGKVGHILFFVLSAVCLYGGVCYLFLYALGTAIMVGM